MKKQRKVKAPQLQIRAALGTVNEEDRTVETVFSTGSDVQRYDWGIGRYIERLSLKPANIRWDRLNGGAPVLNTHSSYSLRDVLGVIVEGSARSDGKQATATLRFAEGNEDSDDAWSKVRQGILKNVSVGYRVHEYNEKTGKDGALPVRTAVDWEPFEISLVPMGADPGAQLRSEDSETNECVITRSGGDVMPNKVVDKDGKPVETAVEAPPEEQTDHDRGVEKERQRTNGISKAVISARMPSTFIQKWIDEGITLEEAQQRALDHVSERGGDSVNGNVPNVIVGDDTGGKLVRDGMTQALLHRGDPVKFELDDNARRFRGMSLMEMGRHILGRASINVEGLDRKEVAGPRWGCRSGRACTPSATSPASSPTPSTSACAGSTTN